MSEPERPDSPSASGAPDRPPFSEPGLELPEEEAGASALRQFLGLFEIGDPAAVPALEARLGDGAAGGIRIRAGG